MDDRAGNGETTGRYICGQLLDIYTDRRRTNDGRPGGSRDKNAMNSLTDKFMKKGGKISDRENMKKELDGTTTATQNANIHSHKHV